MIGRGRGRRGGGQDRFGGVRSDGSLRFSARDELLPRRSSGWGVAPPSRHLWVGSLSPGVTASDLSELFVRCGEVDGIARDPGRSFAFVSFLREEDAVAALRELQGARLRRAPIRIEFSKGDKSVGSSVDDRYTQYADERHFIEHGRKHQLSPEKTIDKSKRNRSEPSEVLWIGFPAGLKVDEEALWEAFLPFGEIAKVTTFPGRTYAFVQYTTIAAACRAKEALQGKLFNNPRVSICFSRNEGVAAEAGKGSLAAPFSPHRNPSARPIFEEQDFEAFPRARTFDSPPRDLRMSSPHFGHKRSSRDADDVGFSRDNYFRQGPEIEPDPVCNFEPFRIRGLGPGRRMSEDLYEQHRFSPTVRRDTVRRDAPWHNIPFERSRRPLPLEDSWDGEDNSYPFPKKLRTGEAHDAELPKYPFSEFDRGQVGSGYPMRPFHDLPEDDAHHRTYPLNHMRGRNHIDPSRNPTPLVDRHEPWRSQDSFARHVEVDRSTPQHHEPLLKEEWKWDGAIAKGGTPICRARCFPVGKALNFMLPEILNCTARTNLDMLAKHYYQAASSWVVFFVPENDADMAAYNDFMNHLGDKQRAAVCKLGERSTLFLVPPSDFSEQVLRVPGKVSISGVILKFQQPNPDLTSPNRQPEALEVPRSAASHLNTDVSSHEDLDALRRLNTPDIRALPQGPNYLLPLAGSYTPASADFVPPYKFEDAAPYLVSQLPQQGPPPDFRGEIAQDQCQRPPNVLPSNNICDPNPGSGNFNSLAPSAILHTLNNRTIESFATQGVPKGTASGYAPGEASRMPLPSMKPTSQQAVRPQQPPSLPVWIPPEQLAQLSTVLAQQNQPAKEVGLPVDSSNKQSGFMQNSNPHGNASVMPDSSGSIPVHNLLLPVPPYVPSQLQGSLPSIQGSLPSNPPIMLPANAPIHSHTTLPLVSPAHSSMPPASFVPPLPEGPPPFRQHTSSAPSVQPLLPSGQQPSAQEDPDGDPQKRLQATLQLAATLLQQIQKQSKPGGQK